MSPPIAAEVNELLRVARDRSLDSRQRLVGMIGDMFLGTDTELTRQEQALMTDILRKLIHEFTGPVRRLLSEKLAKIDVVPREIAVLLANDEFSVAEPILLASTALHDTDLIEVIHQRTLQHQLAIAMRRGLGDVVSAALVETGRVDVIRALLDNKDAKISRATMSYLVDQSRSVDGFQEPILRRHDLPPELARRMYHWVSAALRQYIVSNFAIDPTTLDGAVEESVEESIARHVREQPESSAPGVLAHRLMAAGAITPQLLIQTLRQGEVALFETLLSEMSSLRPVLIRRMLYEAGGESMAVVCRSLGVEKPTFASIYLLSRKARPRSAATRPEELAHLLHFFDNIDPAASQAVVARWRRGGDFLNAARDIEPAGDGR